MKKRAIRIIAAVGGLVALLVLLGWASQLSTDLVPRASDDWSRARVLGTTAVRRPPALNAAPGGGVFVLWANVEGDLQLARLDQAGNVVFNRTLPLSSGTARDPQLVVDTEGTLHLLWRDELGGAAAVRYVQLDSEGYTLSEPIELFRSSRWGIDAPGLAQDSAGRVHAFWVSGEGIEHAVIGSAAEPSLLIPNGSLPSVQPASDGKLYLAWRQRAGAGDDGIYYAAYDPAAGELGQARKLTTLFLRTGQHLEGLSVGLAGSTSCVFWSIEDLRDVSTSSTFTCFPAAHAEAAHPAPLDLYLGWNPGGIATLAGPQERAQVALSAATLATPRGMLLEGLFERQSSIADAVSQVMVIELAGGQIDEQVVTASRQAVVRPAIAAAADGSLHVAALQVGGSDLYRVIYASNAPAVRRAYNAVTVFDVVDTLFNVLMQSALLVLTAIPMLLLWASLPMLGLIIYHWFSGDEELDRMRSRVALSLAIGLEIALTLIFPLRVEMAWPPLVWVAPLVTAALAGILTWRILRRRDQNLLFLSFLTFTGLYVVLLWLAYLVF